MVNIQLLKSKIAEKDKSIEGLSETIGINKSTFYRKINNHGETFSIKEATLLAKELSLSEREVGEIFFAN